MALNTYKTLTDSILAWSKRTEFDGTILADLVKLTETKINNSDLRLTSEEDTYRVTLETNDNYVALPPRYKSIRSIRIKYSNSRKHLMYVTPARLMYVDQPGFPKSYTIANTIEFDRKPDQKYEVFVDYHQLLNPLDSADPDSTNNILDKYPAIYLYGALEEVFNYILDEKRAAGYRMKFYQMISNANQLEETGRFPTDAAPTPPGGIV